MSDREARTYDFLAEPSGATFEGLIRASLTIRGAFQLVTISDWHRRMARGALERLSSFQISSQSSTEWPNTTLADAEPATVFRYRATDEALATLLSLCDHLYGWVNPDLPQDLCFLRTNDVPWLISTADERIGYLNITEHEKQELVLATPGLDALIVDTSLPTDEQADLLRVAAARGIARPADLPALWARVVSDCSGAEYLYSLEEYVEGLHVRELIQQILDAVENQALPKLRALVERLDTAFLENTSPLRRPLVTPNLANADATRYFFAFRLPRPGWELRQDLADAEFADQAPNTLGH
jgi:hypothetical protein